VRKLSVEEIREAMKEGRAVIGTKRTLRELKLGRLSKVVISRNCPIESRKELDRLLKLCDASLEIFPGSNFELGTACKKPFPIAMLGVIKDKDKAR
jgi:large subunit ribosomal protein L30e